MSENLGPRQDGSRLERFLSSNPFVLLIGVVVGVATVIAGVMTYLTTQKIEVLEIQHKAEITELKAKGREEIFNVTQPLKAKIEDLNFRLSSIERRLPGAGPSYLDVSSITIGPEARKTLGTKYMSYDNDGFFLAVPDGRNWVFSLTNELDFARSRDSRFDSNVKEGTPLYNAMSKSPLFVWQNSSELKILVENASVTFHPAISVEHIDQNQLKEAISMVKDDVSDDKQKKDITSKVGPDLDEQRKEAVTDSAKAAIDDKNNESVQNGIEKTLEETKKKQKMIELLNKISTDDLTTYWFANVVFQIWLPSELPEHSKILSAQKKGNVFYVQAQMNFRNVLVTVNGGLPTNSENVSVDQEIFFFGRGVDGYVVQVTLPPLPDRADNFVWSKSWLTGLQIPID